MATCTVSPSGNTYRYEIGDVVLIRMRHYVLNPTTGLEELTDPTDINLYVMEPDLTVTTIVKASLTKNADGDYQYGFPVVQAGIHKWRWVSTGSAAGAAQGSFSSIAALVTP